MVCILKKALYGLKKVSCAWCEKIHAYLVAHGFHNKPNESTLYVKHEGDVLLIIVLYVDDMLLMGPNETHMVDFKAKLHSTFEMSNLGLLHHYLGIQFKRFDGGITLCQTKYLETLLHSFSFEDCKLVPTLWRQIYILAFMMPEITLMSLSINKLLVALFMYEF